MARDYELGLIIDPDVGDDQARTIVDRITQTVATSDGQVVRVNAWGRRRLAYPIDRHRDGLYFYFDLIMTPVSVAELERSLRVNEAILRHIVKVRDPRVAAQQRQREAEAEAQAAAQAAAEAEAAAARAAEEPATARAAEEPAAAETAEPAAEAPAPAAAEVPEEQPSETNEVAATTEAEANA